MKTHALCGALLALSALALLAPRATAAQDVIGVVNYSHELAVQLQPLRPALGHARGLAKELVPLAKSVEGKRFSTACSQADRLRAGLFRRAAHLFFGADRRKADPTAIEAFLDRYVRSPSPLLEIAAEGFVPAAPWRALATEACLRANRAAIAVDFLTATASAQPGGLTATALAVVFAARARNWPAGVALLREGGGSPIQSVQGNLLLTLANPCEAGQTVPLAQLAAAGDATALALVSQVAEAARAVCPTGQGTGR